MLKMRGRDSNGAPLIVLGLSHRNLELLREGKPIAFNLSELGLVGSCIICAGPTEKAIADEFLGHAKAAGTAIHAGKPPVERLEPQ